jgi:hypothetical protein
MLVTVRGYTPEEEIMLSTWDRNPASAARWNRAAAHGRKHVDSMGQFLKSVDVLIYVVGTALAASVIAIVL